MLLKYLNLNVLFLGLKILWMINSLCASALVQWLFPGHLKLDALITKNTCFICLIDVSAQVSWACYYL